MYQINIRKMMKIRIFIIIFSCFITQIEAQDFKSESGECDFQWLTSQPRLIKVKQIIKDRLGNIASIIGEYDNQEIFISGVRSNDPISADSKTIETYSFYLFDLEEDGDYNRFRDVWDMCVGRHEYGTHGDLPRFKAKNIINGKYYFFKGWNY